MSIFRGLCALSLIAICPLAGCGDDSDGGVDSSVPDAGRTDGGGGTDSGCTPECGARVCGLDSVCNESCGVCPMGMECLPDGTCNACTSNADCDESPRGRTCDIASGICTNRCEDPAQCAGHPLSTFACDDSTSSCVQCVTTADCLATFTTAVVCDTTTLRCEECVESADCPEAGQTCLDNNCIECEVATDCGTDEGCAPGGWCTGSCAIDDDCGIGGKCHPTRLACVGCVDDGDCMAGNRCDPRTAQCRPGCIADADCPGGGRCESGGNCVECFDDRDCIDNPAGERCSYGNRCVECLPSQTCLGRICGDRDDACGSTISCGSCGLEGSCLGGTDCDCPPDESEPNDSQVSATDLGMFTDDPDSRDSRVRSIHSDDDHDWYEFAVDDTGFLGNPIVTVRIDRRSHFNPFVEPDFVDVSEYEVAVWYTCDGDGDAHTCDGQGVSGSTDPETATATCVYAADGSFDRSIEAEIATECGGTDESGTVRVRVRKKVRGGLCDAYSLEISVR